MSSDDRKYKTLPNLRSRKTVHKNKEKDDSTGERCRRSLVESFFFSSSAPKEERAKGGMMSRICVIGALEFDKKKRRSNSSGRLRRVLETGASKEIMDREIAAKEHHPTKTKKKKQRMQDHSDDSVVNYGGNSSVKKLSQKDKQDELDAIIEQIHSNLSYREALDGYKHFSAGEQKRDSPPFSELSNSIYKQQRFLAEVEEAGTSARAVRRKLPTRDEIYDLGAKAGRIFRNDGLIDDDDEDVQMNGFDTTITLSKPAGKQSSIEKSRSMYDFFDILDEHREFFEHLKDLNLSKRRKKSITSSKNNCDDEHFSSKDMFDAGDQIGKSNVSCASGADGSKRTNSLENEFCDISYDDEEHGRHFGSYGDVDGIDNVTYFTAGDLDAIDALDELSFGGDSSSPSYRRVSGRRDQGVWTDTLSAAAQVRGTRVEGREAGWWKRASAKKNAAYREQQLRIRLQNHAAVMANNRTTYTANDIQSGSELLLTTCHDQMAGHDVPGEHDASAATSSSALQENSSRQKSFKLLRKSKHQSGKAFAGERDAQSLPPCAAPADSAQKWLLEKSQQETTESSTAVGPPAVTTTEEGVTPPQVK